MLSKSSCLVIVIFVLSASFAKANDNSSLDVGTTVFLKMTGELALKFGQQTGLLPNDLNSARGLKIDTSAQIVRKLEDGSVQLEHTTMINQKSREPLLITLAATVKPDAITVRETPAGTLVYSSPADSNPVAIAKPTRSYQIQLRDLKGVKLRTWKLQSEFGH